MAKASGSNKMRKVGRNALFCQNYKNRNQRERNKLVKVKKHLVRFVNDLVAVATVDRLKTAIRGF
jgi:hypothetical protein